MRVLFVGGTGNLSAACARLAVERGHDTTVLTRGSRSADLPPAVHRVVGDARDPAALGRIVAEGRFDAAVSFIVFTPEQARADIAAFAGRVGQYVFISSAAVYEKPPRHHVVTERTPRANPYWDYARLKIAAEDVYVEAHRASGFPMTIVRPSYTYGESWVPTAFGSDYTSVWRLRRGLPLIAPGDGTSLWVLTHASDFARGLVGLLGAPAALGEDVHITSDEVLTWNQIHQAIAAAAGAELRLVHIPSDFVARVDARRGASLLGDKAWSLVFDNTKVKGLVPGFRATVPFADGVRRSIAWLEADASRQVTEANATVEAVLAAWRLAVGSADDQ
jgi:nucleoside-diphosphate-sugar epimerase